jgi:hypothetical protein
VAAMCSNPARPSVPPPPAETLNALVLGSYQHRNGISYYRI